MEVAQEIHISQAQVSRLEKKRTWTYERGITRIRVTIQDQCMEINESSCLHVRDFDFHTLRS